MSDVKVMFLPDNRTATVPSDSTLQEYEYFVASLFMPHTQMEMFPSVAAKLQRTAKQVQP